MKAEKCSYCVLLIKYILCNKVMLDYIFVYLYILLMKESMADGREHYLPSPRPFSLSLSIYIYIYLFIYIYMHYQFAIMFSTLYCTLHMNHILWSLESETVTRIVETHVPLQHKSVYVYNNNNNNYCNWFVTRWQWLFYMYTKHEIGY